MALRIPLFHRATGLMSKFQTIRRCISCLWPVCLHSCSGATHSSSSASSPSLYNTHLQESTSHVNIMHHFSLVRNWLCNRFTVLSTMPSLSQARSPRAHIITGVILRSARRRRSLQLRTGQSLDILKFDAQSTRTRR